MRAKTWAPVVTFVVIAAVGTTVALIDRDGASPAKGPRTLRLASGVALGAPTAAGGGESGYQLATTLSADKPADQQAFDLSTGPADHAVVAQLADALHTGVPVRSGDGWRAGGLTVSGRAGQPWTWTSCAPAAPVAPDDATAGSGCAVSGVAVQPGSTPPPDMSTGAVTAAVRDVFSAVGLDVADARTDASPYGGSATLATPGISGLDTVVSVDRTGAFTYASGWLGHRVAADTYPVISAKDAYADLPALVHPDLCRLGPDGKGCLPPDPVVITGATLGLSVQATTGGGSVLVPSWLFTTRTSGVIPVIAVERQYRTTTAPKPVPLSTTKAPVPLGTGASKTTSG